MPNSAISSRGWWRLLLALLLSLLLHLWLAGGLDGWLPDEDASDRTLISVELQPNVAPKPAPKPVATSVPQRVKPVAPKSLQHAEPVVSPVVEPPTPAAVIVPEPAPQATGSPVPPPGEVVAVPVEEASPPPRSDEPVLQTPKKVAIEYQVVRKGGVAGVEHHDYQVKADGSYTLSSTIEAKGLLALVVSNLTQQSEGQVTARGLKPSTYRYQYGKNPDKAQKATFDWQAGTLVMEAGKNRQQVELPEDTQDLLSFMYQFMFVPPLQQMHLAVTNGKKFKIYNYGFEGEETLTTKMGPVRTLRIGKSNNDGDEKTEIWLAADYHYLPVKISQTEKDGTVTERIATHLQIE